MAQTVSLLLSARDRVGLRDVIEDRGRPVKHVQRAQIVLASADHLPVLEIANRVGVSRPMVWRWQRRYAEEGLEGLLRDKTRPPGIPPVPQAKVHALVERTLRAPPGAVTHWTGRAMAKAMGLSLRTVQRIWSAHPRHPRQLRRSQAPRRAGMACGASAMDVPLHADLVLMAQRRRRLLLSAHPAEPEAGRLPLCR